MLNVTKAVVDTKNFNTGDNSSCSPLTTIVVLIKCLSFYSLGILPPPSLSLKKPDISLQISIWFEKNIIMNMQLTNPIQIFKTEIKNCSNWDIKQIVLVVLLQIYF